MTRNLLLSFLLLSSVSAFGQNMVTNGSFETFTSLPNGYGQYQRATGWQNCSGSGTPDYFHTAGSVPNYFGQIAPSTGGGQMGFATYHATMFNFREYLSRPLNTPLIPGNTYTVTFYLSNGNAGGYSKRTNNIGAHFSVGPLFQGGSGTIAVIPQVEITTMISHVNTWQQYSFTFTATTAANYITIGNFRADGNTMVSATGTTGAYYFIDDIEVIPGGLGVTGPTSVCAGNSVTLVAAHDTTFAWANNQNPSVIISQNDTLVVTPTTTTTYLVYGSSDTVSHTVTVNAVPAVNLGNDTAFCTGNSITLNAASTGATYLWQDNSTSSTLTAQQSGTYWVDVTVNGCTSRDSIDITLNPAPVFDLGNDTAICQGNNVVLATNHSGNHVWQDGSTNATFNASQSGQYWVTVTASGCSETDTFQLTVNPIPDPQLGADTTLCEGTPFLLNPGIQNASYLWQNGSTSGTQQISNSGIYWVDVTLNNCTGRDSIVVNYQSLPQLDLGNDTTFCEGGDLLLDASFPGSTALWHNNSTNPTYLVQQTGTYWVQVQLNGCSVADTIQVVVTPLPIVVLADEFLLCTDSTVLLDVSGSGAQTYLWSDGSQGAFIQVATPGLYWIESGNNGCFRRDSTHVYTFDFKLTGDTSACAGESILLQSPQAGTIIWQDNSTSSIFMATTSGMYSATYHLGGCIYQDSVSVEFTDCETHILMPNVFSPNGDGANEIFTPVGNYNVINPQLAIFNRWGQLIFESNDLRSGWDGRTAQGAASEGTYFWTLYFDNISGERKSIFGHVTLLR